MIPITRREIEILLDTPNEHNYVVSAYADMTVKDGFSRHVDIHLRNQAREVSEALAEGKATKDLDANLEVIRQLVQNQAQATPAIKGLAVFSCVARKLRHVVPLNFPVENRLIIDEEPFILPLLERWYGEPSYLIALTNSDEVHLFEAHHGLPEPAGILKRDDADQEIQRDKPKLTYKKRFASTHHERLHGDDDSKFLHEVAETIAEHWHGGHFAGLILLGQSPMTATVRRLLPRALESAVLGEAPHAMTNRPEELTEAVAKIVERSHLEHDRRFLDELNERWKEKHLVASGPTEVLDALQQGRATQILLGAHHEMPGGRCRDCGYRFGAPVAICPYCQGRCHACDAAQDIMRMAMRHQVPVHVLRATAKTDPLATVGGVAALLRAEANWAPNSGAARASEGH